ncbi:MAG: imidazole glycerol phosphate synthase subunit HisH [Halioglobus sp.]
MPDIAIIDYSIGNIFSVFQACKIAGMTPHLVNQADKLQNFDAVILPGVGSFPKGMENLKQAGLDESVKEFISSGKPFMGICLGMQLLLNKSEEFGMSNGLGLIDGEVKHLRTSINDKNLPVPKITWGNVNPEKDWTETPLQNVRHGADFYFVHSYYCDVFEHSAVLGTSKYGDLSYASAIFKDNIFALQFHPEKSGTDGIRVYKDWNNLHFT